MTAGSKSRSSIEVKTRAPLPPSVQEIYGDRSDPDQLRRAVGSGGYEVVVDTTLYTGEDALAAARIFESRARRYIVLSSGQVYLVRSGLSRPYQEKDYAGPTIPAPENSLDYDEWLYGINKRAAEDALMLAYHERGFPVTVLRLPMVNSERDHFDRISGYLARLRDGGPILIPEGPHLRLRHVYGGDVVRGIIHLAMTDRGLGEAYNLSQDEEVSIEEFLEMLADLAGTGVRIVSVPRPRLEAENLIPDCSPFSDPWMSNLDNWRSKQEMAMVYTSLAQYLSVLVRHLSSPARVPPGYNRRAPELQLAEFYSLR